ncbi:MAG: hypothetical protein KF867_02325 [Cryobacterium sp.]|nr:hypothetical protein [Cryobacterium sp.]
MSSREPVDREAVWSVPGLDECPQVQRNTLNEDSDGRILQISGYLNGELSYFEYTYEASIDEGKVGFARVWTEKHAVIHAEFDKRGRELSNRVVAKLFSQEDVVKANPVAVNVIMSYLNTQLGGELA